MRKINRNVNTVEEQTGITLEKEEIRSHERYGLQRFEVI